MSGSRKRAGADKEETRDEPLLTIDLDDKKRVSVSKFKSYKMVDIREYYVSNGEKKPGKKGIALSQAVWEKLMESREAITAALKELDMDKGPKEAKNVKKVKSEEKVTESDDE